MYLELLICLDLELIPIRESGKPLWERIPHYLDNLISLWSHLPSLYIDFILYPREWLLYCKWLKWIHKLSVALPAIGHLDDTRRVAWHIWFQFYASMIFHPRRIRINSLSDIVILLKRSFSKHYVVITQQPQCSSHVLSLYQVCHNIRQWLYSQPLSKSALSRVNESVALLY